MLAETARANVEYPTLYKEAAKKKKNNKLNEMR